MEVGQLKSVSNLSIADRFKAYIALMKLRLSSLVVMSAFFGYLLAGGTIYSVDFVFLIIGGILITGSANGFNQIIEIKTDELMLRTQTRPLPSGILSKIEAFIFCFIVGTLGLYLLLEINFKCLILGILAIVIYALIYTPLKRITPFAVFVGAIPGSIPPLLGYIACSNAFGLEPGILFIIQFFWQFPHFWALAWKLDDDYKKADPTSYHQLSEAIDEAAFDQISIEDKHCCNDLTLLEQFQNKTVIFGAVAIASSRLETVDEVRERLQAAMNHIDRDRLVVAPDCGLGLLSPKLAEDKLRVMCQAAALI